MGRRSLGKKFPPDFLPRITELYLSGRTGKEIALAMDCSHVTVLARLKEAGVAIRNNGTRFRRVNKPRLTEPRQQANPSPARNIAPVLPIARGLFSGDHAARARMMAGK